MTTFEHAMVGITGAVAAGLQERYGWRVVAVAALAAISPDWDALTLLGGPALFDRAHRVWGHNVLVAGLIGALIGELDYRTNASGRVGQWLGRYIKSSAKQLPSTRALPALREPARAIWLPTGALAALSHLPADLVVSGTATLPDWEVKLAWPFSDHGWVYPLVRWGDPGISVVFAVGMLAMAKWPARIRLTAIVTLFFVIAYAALRRIIWP